MGGGDSKLHSRKFDRPSVRYPIETTEIIASDYESLIVDPCSNLQVNQSYDIGLPMHTLTNDTFNASNNISLSRNDLVNFSTNNTIWPSDSNLVKSTDDSRTSNYPKIHKLNSQVELLSTSFAEQVTDEFQSSDSEINLSDSENLESYLSSDNDNDYHEDADAEDADNDEASASTALSDSSVYNNDDSFEHCISYDKNFIQKFKDRYTNCGDEFYKNRAQNTSDLNNFNCMCMGEFEDSFTEITKIVSTKRNVKKADPPEKTNIIDRIQSRLKGAPKILSKLKTPTISKSVNIVSEDESEEHNSLTLLQSDCTDSSLSTIRQNIYSSYDNNQLNFTLPGFRNLCYKFWVDATYETWKIFHNNRDRRIESIGRLSNCQIRLTKITQRSSRGMLKRQVFVYASNLGDLEKCCKLFDDKFPQFCASASLKIDSSLPNMK